MNPPIERMIYWVRRYIQERKGVNVHIVFPHDHWNHYLLREAYAIAMDYFNAEKKWSGA